MRALSPLRRKESWNTMDGNLVKADVVDRRAGACCGDAASPLATAERLALIRSAFRLEWMTVAWMVVEGVVAIGAGVAAGSLTLMAFGLYNANRAGVGGHTHFGISMSELHEDRPFQNKPSEPLAALAARCCSRWPPISSSELGGASGTGTGEAFTLPGLIVALLALPIMTVLARRKITVRTPARQSRHARRCGGEHHLRMAIACGGGGPLGRRGASHRDRRVERP